nr:MAG TPA: hypothetical protein [Caudoviricetes sp.]
MVIRYNFLMLFPRILKKPVRSPHSQFDMMT